MKHAFLTLLLALYFGPGTSYAQSGGGDRTIGIELNRDRSENRIERLREESQQGDKARAQEEQKKGSRPKLPAKSGEDKRQR